MLVSQCNTRGPEPHGTWALVRRTNPVNFVGVSLLEFGGDVRFVRWTVSQANPGDGQILTVRDRRLVFPMNLEDRESMVQNFKSRFVVHPDLQLDVEKTKVHKESALVPNKRYTLFRMWSLGLVSGRTPLKPTCFVCDKPCSLLMCPLCLMTMHDRCADLLSTCQRRLGLTKSRWWC